MISLLGRLHVIIVDDHIMVAEGIRDLLKGHVASAGVVASGEDLLSSLATFVPDVILMDIGMPKLNGLDTLDALKRAGCEAGVIMLTMHRATCRSPRPSMICSAHSRQHCKERYS
jgi:DNA-binding NarL/FixJ family response regulator